MARAAVDACSDAALLTIKVAAPPDGEVKCAHPGAGLAGRCWAATAPAGSGFSFADGGSDPPDAEANNTTTNDTLAKLNTNANATQATLALDESGSNFTDCMTLPSARTGQR
jgi:hypothetical protein